MKGKTETSLHALLPQLRDLAQHCSLVPAATLGNILIKVCSPPR